LQTTKLNPPSHWPARLGRWLDRIEVSEQLVVSATAVIVGAGTALGAVLFIRMVDGVGQIETLVRGRIGSALGLLLVMAVAGLLVGLIVDHFAREAKGHGVPEVMEAVLLRGGRIRPQVAVAKVAASSLTIGSGGSGGREGPIVQVGAALGSSLGQLLRFSNERVRTLVACGAAAGIAAAFNAPIAASIFALEVILGRFTSRYFGAVVISAVTSSIVARVFLGDKPAFEVPAYPLSHARELLIYLLLGVLAAVVGVVIIRSLYWAEHVFDTWSVPNPIKTSLGLVLTGVVGLALAGEPVLGSGLRLIGEAISTDFQFSIGLMTVMMAMKLLATLFTLGSGNSGGVFAPALFIGAMLGGIVGQVGNSLWPGVVVHPGAYALVGMAAVFSAAARAPMSAILIVFEMSNDYRLILPLMLATVVATFGSEMLFRESIYTLKLKLKGISLRHGRAEDVMNGVLVSEVLSQGQTISSSATLADAQQFFETARNRTVAMVDPHGKLAGVLSLVDIERAEDQSIPAQTPAIQVGTPRQDLQIAFGDETVGEALVRMSGRGLGLLPVVERADHDHLIGQVRRDDIMRAYELGLARRGELEHRAEALRKAGSSMAFVEFTLAAGSWPLGKPISEVGRRLPQNCVLISIRRGERTIVPHGKTQLMEGDKVLAYVERQELDAVRTALA
jgi:CIC family chloride channel protein